MSIRATFNFSFVDKDSVAYCCGFDQLDSGSWKGVYFRRMDKIYLKYYAGKSNYCKFMHELSWRPDDKTPIYNQILSTMK